MEQGKVWLPFRSAVDGKVYKQVTVFYADLKTENFLCIPAHKETWEGADDDETCKGIENDSKTTSSAKQGDERLSSGECLN